MIHTEIESDKELREIKAKMLGSFLYFTQVFFKIRTGKEFHISSPVGRESHHKIIARELTSVFRLEEMRLFINVPPGHGKSTLLQHFVAWAWAHYPDCNFLYISYGHDEAKKNTYVIKQIVDLPEYYKFFGVKIKSDSSAKDDFSTNFGGMIKAFGSSGPVTGKDAGFPNADRFSGALIMDDMHKPDEVYSDTLREGVIENYKKTMVSRVRGPKVAQIGLGQRLHEDDLPAYLLNGKNGDQWKSVVLKAIDGAGNVLDESVRTKQQLEAMRDYNKFTFWAQYQQDPQPSDGGIFNIDDFWLYDQPPEYISTFITADTAETNKDWNDASVFSFWGLYKVNDLNRKELSTYALDWIDCVELRVEPKDLEKEFLSFYGSCLMHKMPPKFAAIERKSTGTTLVSILSGVRGIQILPIERNASSHNKITRYLDIQPYISKKLVSLPRYGKHTHICLEHCKKITANGSHRHDDIADTLYDAVKIGLIDKILINMTKDDSQDSILLNMAKQMNQINSLKSNAYRGLYAR